MNVSFIFLFSSDYNKLISHRLEGLEDIECDTDIQISQEKCSINNALDALIAPIQVKNEEALLSDHPPELADHPDLSQLVILH